MEKKAGMSQSGVTSEFTENSDSESKSKSEDDTSKSLRIVTKRKKVSTPVSILIASLIKNMCRAYVQDPQKSENKYNLICNKLQKMHMIDESYNMSEFDPMRAQFESAFMHIITSNATESKSLPLTPLWPKIDVTNSHYLREFHEIKYIAGGGFGEVYLVKHKLDDTEYAIKKIPIRSEGIKSVRNYLSEVKTFASLNHSNIVQYKAAWLEIGGPKGHKMLKSESSIKHVDDKYVFHKDVTQSFSETENEDESFLIEFERSLNNITECTEETSSSQKSKSKSSSGSNAIYKLEVKDIKQLNFQKRSKAKWATLYIQMALCQSTLKQWLEKRSEESNKNKALVPINNDKSLRMKAIFEILIQILKGLEYMHSKGMVHHDIKPSNIFIQLENDNFLVQLGDFGLACPLQSVRHSLAFGTELYAAPEQLEGECQSKSDLYSLGIVLYELVENFSTDMERVQWISELRKGNLSPHIETQSPQIASMIRELTSNNLDDRPTASVLLKRIIKSTESEQLEVLKQQLEEKEEEILHLKELLKSHGIKGI